MAIKTYKRGDATKITPSFRAREFDCPCRKCKETLIDSKLVDFCQKIRDHFNKAMTIEIGYRCESFNSSVSNASKTSKHTQGMAADITIKGVKPKEIAKYAEKIGVLGIGLYDTDEDGHFVHIDTRTSKFFWKGHAQKSVSTFQEEKYSLEQFVKDVQKEFGCKVTGVANEETLKSTITVSKSKNKKHDVVEFIQKRLKALGYTQVGTANGVADSKFDKAVKALQKDIRPKEKKFWDGEITAEKTTWKYLLGMKI